MGTWDTGPFDNDSAADFAHVVRDGSGPDARQDLLLATIRAGAEHLKTARLENEYAWGHELEMAIAATAFVADAYTGEKEFTDTSYARGVGDDMQLLPYVEFHPPTEELVMASRRFLITLLLKMRRDRIHRDRMDPIRVLRAALDEQPVGD